MKSYLQKIQNEINNKTGCEITCSEWHSSIILEGIADEWTKVYKAGEFASNKGYKGVVNKINVKNLIIPEIKKPLINDNKLDGKKVDILVIGGGIVGCSILRELSKWNISCMLVEKEMDVAMQASSRNDGMIHPGIEPRPGSKKAYYNVKGNKMYSKIAKELDVPFRRSGSIILYDKLFIKLIKPFMMDRAKKNQVEGIRFISKDEVKKTEPYVTDNICGGVYFSTTGVIPPYKMTVAYAENAIMNGAEISLGTIVLSMKKEQNRLISVQTNRGVIYPHVVINAAGVYADKIADMAGDQFFTIHPRKGEIVFLDNKKGKYVTSIVAKPNLSLAKGHTKGGGIVKTCENNILVGPDAYEQPYREDFSTNKENIDKILDKQLPIVPGLKASDVITYCAGIRASTYEEDFIIEASEYIENLVYAAGIQSPGFASAPAIAEEIQKIACNILKKYIELKPKKNWNPIRKGIPDLKNMTFEKRCEYIKKKPDYGIIICRCEEISKGEILDALHSPLPVTTLDGIKRRVRAGMGRCQGGFCTPQLMEIFSQETGTDMLSITKKGGKSYMLCGETKENDIADKDNSLKQKEGI